jgi:hypothetical protein
VHGAVGDYLQCRDNGGAVVYQASLRVDPKHPTDPPLAGRVDTAPADAGWTMSDPRPTGAGAERNGTKGDLTISVTYRTPDSPTPTSTDPDAYTDYALIEILGPCIDVGDADQTYTNPASERLPLD